MSEIRVEVEQALSSGEGIRLTGGATAQDGILQVLYSGEWRGVCDDGWGAAETEVACRQLFGPTSTGTYDISNIGPESAFWLDDVSCTGAENSLFDCTHDGWGSHNCSISEHVWLTCTP